jgi:hypothetical protein
MADDYDHAEHSDLDLIRARLADAERRLRRQGRILWVLVTVVAVGACGASYDAFTRWGRPTGQVVATTVAADLLRSGR